MNTNLTETIIDTTNGMPCEIEYRDAENTLVGFWAYGSFDPELPYQGDEGAYSRITERDNNHER